MDLSQSEMLRKVMERYNKFSNPGNFSNNNMTHMKSSSFKDKSAAQIFYVITTIIIIVMGICGNSICIRHMTRKRVLRQSSAQYFGVFCIFDILVLVFYVFPEWLNRGIYPLTGFEMLRLHSNPGMCQLYLFLTYWLRLVSVWTLAAYSVDRYMGLKNPQRRRLICGSHYNVKVIVTVTVLSLLFSLWKPFLSRTTTNGSRSNLICGSNSPNMFFNFVYDAIYGCMLSIVPSILIIVMNILIAVQLMSWRSNQSPSLISRQELIGFQFAALLILISSSFLFLSWPYFIVWLHSWWQHYNFRANLSTQQISEIGQTKAANLITRVLFYFHFGINIFLYTIASKYFRSQIKHVFTLRKLREQANEYYKK